jgi:hypothetical protein
MKTKQIIFLVALAILFASACQSGPTAGKTKDGGKALEEALAGIKDTSISSLTIDLASVSPERVFSLAPAASTTVTPIPPPATGGFGTVSITFQPDSAAPNNLTRRGNSGVFVVTIKNTGKTRKTITLRKSGTAYTEADRGSLFFVGENVKLILEGDITLDGLIVNAPYRDNLNNNASLIVVGRNGSVELGRGVRLTGNYAPAGGAVYIDRGGSGVQDGAVITGNTAYTSHTGGAGVYVGPEGSYALKSGEITGNHTVNLDDEIEGGAHGGGLWVSGSFVQSGGSITNNSSPIHCGAIMVSDGNITLSGGAISGNKAICAPGIFMQGALTLSGDARLSNANSIELVQGSVITQSGVLTGSSAVPVSLFGGTAADWANKAIIVPASGTVLTANKINLLATTSMDSPVPIPADYALGTDGVFKRN